MVFHELKISERDINERLIRAVQKHECLYDVTMEDYSKRSKCESAWLDVAREMNENGKADNEFDS